MLIKQVALRNFKRFEELIVEFQNLDCLVGANNSGKTTLLQALALFDFCVQSCLSRRNGSGFEIKSRSIYQEEFFVVPVTTPVELWTDRRTQHNGNPVLITIQVTFDNAEIVTATVDLSFNRFSMQLEANTDNQAWLEQLHQFRIAYLPVFSSFLPQEERRTRAIIEDALGRGRVNIVIRNLLLDLKDRGQDAELVTILRRVFPDLNDLKIEFDEANDRYIQVNYREKDRSKELDLFASGSGFQQFIYLFGFILLRQPTMILLDEPDKHLHGTLQSALVKELERLVTNGKQVILATHSREIINQLDPTHILTLEANQVRRLKIAFDIYDVLDQLGSTEQTQLPIIQMYRRVLLLENDSDWKLITIFGTKVLGEARWSLVERRLARCFFQGNPSRQPHNVSRLREQLNQMITHDGSPLKMFVIADRDYAPDVDTLRASLPTQHMEWHVWERNEIENYLLVLPAISRLIYNDLERPLERAELEAEWARMIEDSKDQVNDKLVKAFAEFNRNLDASTCSRKAREFLKAHWDTSKLGLTDAKDTILPSLKRWAQDNGFKQFSDQVLAKTIQSDELPLEVHDLIKRLAVFAGIPTTEKT
jgi:predicted ATPase